MDNGFVGLIGSVFERPQDGVPARVRLIAFQAAPGPAGGQAHVQVDVPLRIAPSPGAIPFHALSKLVALQYNLFMEEKATYEAVLSDLQASDGAAASTDKSPTARAARCAPMATLHASAVYNKALARLMELVTLPLATTLTDHLVAAKRQLAELETRRDELAARSGASSSLP